MKRRTNLQRAWIFPAILLLVLCALAPFSSHYPDAVQKLAKWPGGTGNFFKALGGAVATFGIVIGLFWSLKMLQGKKLG